MLGVQRNLTGMNSGQLGHLKQLAVLCLLQTVVIWIAHSLRLIARHLLDFDETGLSV